MAIFRPSNLNKRLTGTPTTATGGSPGNGGQIGPTKTPYIGKKIESRTLGLRIYGGGCAGVFKLNESFCGSYENCSTTTDLGGFLICLSGGVRWIVAPSSSEVSRNWYGRNDASTRAQQVTGCTGWFIPDGSQLINPAACCRSYWDSYCLANYWSSSHYKFQEGVWASNFVNMSTGSSSWTQDRNVIMCVRSLRCVNY